VNKIDLNSLIKILNIIMFYYLKELINYLFNQNMNVIYFDFETTGLNPYHDKIIDFCFLKEPICSNMTDVNEDFLKNPTSSDKYFHIDENYFQALVNPNRKLSAKIIEITNITDVMLKDKPNIEQFIPSIETYVNKECSDVYLIAHNNHGFDQLFLERAFRYNGFEVHQNNWKFIDTLLLAKRLNPNMFSYSLKTLCKYYNITPGEHRALSDCVALRKVYMKLLEKLNKDHFNGTNSLKYLLKNPNIVYDFLYYN
jgi:DNA polymerase III subunit alpha, Gram-positive type